MGRPLANAVAMLAGPTDNIHTICSHDPSPPGLHPLSSLVCLTLRPASARARSPIGAVNAIRIRRTVSWSVLCAILLAWGAVTPLRRAIGGNQQHGTDMRLYLDTPHITWRAIAGTRATFTLAFGGDVVGQAEVVAQGDGVVETTLLPVGGARTPSAARLRAGAVLTTSLAGTAPFAVTVPAVTVQRARGAAASLSAAGPPRQPYTATFRAAHEVIGIEAGVAPASGHVVLSSPVGWRAGPGHSVTLDWRAADGTMLVRRWDAARFEAFLGSTRTLATAPHGSLLEVNSARSGKAIARAGPSVITGAPNVEPSMAMDLVPTGVGDPRIRAGDMVSLSMAAGLLVSGTAPRIRARVLPNRDEVAGIGPAGARLDLVARNGDVLATRVVTVAASGAFSTSFAGAGGLDLLAETRVSVHRDEAEGALRWTAQAEAERMTVTLGSPDLQGRAAPETTVAASLRTAGVTRTLAEDTTQAGPDGAFALRMLDSKGATVDAAQGQRLLGVWEFGGAVDVSLPNLMAAVDTVLGVVSGVAPPGALVRVRMAGTNGTFEERAGLADSQGRYAVPFPDRDADDAWHGDAAIRVGDALTVVRPFARVHVHARVGEPAITIEGPPKSRLRVVLERGGIAIAEGEGTLPDDGWGAGGPGSGTTSSANLESRDQAGFVAPVSAGDVLRVWVGGSSHAAEVPTIAWESNTVIDRVTGYERAAESVTIQAGRAQSSSPEQPLDVDEEGVFRLATRDEIGWDLRPGDTVTVTARTGVFSFVESAHVAGLQIDMDRGRVTGLAGPGSRLTAGLYEAGGRRVAQAAASADPAGHFDLSLRDVLGAAVVPGEGQTLVVQEGTRVTTTLVPRLLFAVDTIADRLTGELAPGGRLLADVSRPTGDRGARARVELEGATGRWVIDLKGRLDLAAGSAVVILAQGIAGEEWLRETRVPQLHARVDDVVVHGTASPNATVWISVTRGGAMLAGGQRTATDSGAFEAVLSDDPAATWLLRAGDEVEASWQGGSRTPHSGALVMRVVGLGARIEDGALGLRGWAPPDSDVLVLLSGPGLPSRVPGITQRPAADGTFRLAMPLAELATAGLTAEVGVLDEGGHRSYVVDRLPYLEVRLNRAVFTGRARPRSSLAFTLLEGGRVVATAREEAGSTGAFVARFAAPDDSSVSATSGGRLEVREVDGRMTRLELPLLSVSIDAPGRAVRGLAPPGQEIALRLLALGRPALTVHPRADAGGRWAVSESALPAGAEVAGLRLAEARVSAGGGHRVVAVAGPGATPPVVPPSSTPPADATAPVTATASPNRPTATGATPTASRTPQPDVGTPMPTTGATVGPSATPDGARPFALFLPVCEHGR